MIKPLSLKRSIVLVATICGVVFSTMVTGVAAEPPPISAPSCWQRDGVLSAYFGPKQRQPSIYSVVFVVSDPASETQFTEIVPVDATSTPPIGLNVEPIGDYALSKSSRVECYVTSLLGSRRSSEYTGECAQGHSDLGLDARIGAVEVTPTEAYVRVTVRYAENGIIDVRYLKGEPLMVRDSATGETSRVLVYGPTPVTEVVGVGIRGSPGERLEVGVGSPESSVCL